MLTIKIITPNLLEFVKEVKSVMRRPESESASGRPCVTYFETGIDTTANDVFEGQVYVMNDNGNTIAAYDLGNPLGQEASI